MAKRVKIPPDEIASWNSIQVGERTRNESEEICKWIDAEMAGQYYMRTTTDWPRNNYEYCFESENDALWFKLRWS